MAKVMNLGVHCSERIHYQGIRPFMYCMALQKRITARKKRLNIVNTIKSIKYEQI